MKLMWTDIKKEFNEKGYFKGHECSHNQYESIEYKKEGAWLRKIKRCIYLDFVLKVETNTFRVLRVYKRYI